jgi:ferredoxin-NADP reductase
MASPRKLRAQVVDIKEYIPTVRSYKLRTEGVPPRFKPGQFLHLSIYEYDPSFNWPESRCFSIANAPNADNEIDLVISKKGEYTSKIFEQVEIGSYVWIKLPYGVFNFDESIGATSVLIAGGTGVSPYMSFLRYILSSAYDPKIKLYYGVKNKNVFMIENLINECRGKLQNFTHSFFIEQDPVSLEFDYKVGFLDIRQVIIETKHLSDALYYLSGPPQMISVFEEKLAASGIERNNLRFDKWE